MPLKQRKKEKKTVKQQRKAEQRKAKQMNEQP